MKKTSIFIIDIMALMLIGTPVLAQKDVYRIGPRDVINLIIYAGGAKQDEVQLTVSSEGMIGVPFIGSIKAEGLTGSELEAAIIEPLAKDYFVNPEVIIQLKEYHSLRYYIAGAVKSPGMYEMTSEATLVKLIAKAGGVMPNRGKVAYILRDSIKAISETSDVEHLVEESEPVKIDLLKLLDEGDMKFNIELQSGDVVYIPIEKTQNIAEANIYIEGEVKKPGVYTFQPGLTGLNACIMAGGFTKFAAPNRTRIIRKDGDSQVIIKIDLNDVKRGKTPDVDLKPGDLIHVPETWL